MDELKLETYKDNNAEIEQFLSDSITNYGVEQLQGDEPTKIYCCLRDEKGNIIAGIMGSVTLNLFFISHIFVEKDFRNKGIGAKLLSAIESLALNMGCNILRLNTFNKKAHAFYVKAGFKETVSISDYMNGFDLAYYHKKIS